MVIEGVLVTAEPSPTAMAVPNEAQTDVPAETQADTPDGAQTAMPAETQTAMPRPTPRLTSRLIPDTTPAAAQSQTAAAAPGQTPAEAPAEALPEEEIEPQSLELPSLKKLRVSGHSSIRVNVFADLNANGNQGKSEKGIPDVPVELVFIDEFRQERYQAATGVTGEDGTVLFGNLRDGVYAVRAELPEGYVYGEKTNQTNSLKDSAMNAQSAPQQESAPFVLKQDSEWSFGISAAPAATISGRAWIDLNGDGSMDEDEPPLAGQTIEMRGQKNDLIYRTVTDEDGNYAFMHLRRGTYRMNVTLPDQYRLTRYVRSEQFRRGKSELEGEQEISETFEFDQNNLNLENQNIGVYEISRIAGICYAVDNENGAFDGDEAGVAGTEIRLRDRLDDRVIQKTETDQDGGFELTGVRPGSYELEIVLPQRGYAFPEEADGEIDVQSARKGIIYLEIGGGEESEVQIRAVRK